MPNEQLIVLGILLVVVGLIVLFIGSIVGAEKTQVKVGVGGFIGPIPFGFANDPRILWAAITLTFVLLLLFLFFFR